MTAITTLGAQMLSDFNTSGLPGTGVKSPPKIDGRALFALIDGAISGIALGGSIAFAKDTRALLVADLNWPANTIAIVNKDTTSGHPEYNDLYIKSGASGSGAWTALNLLTTPALAAQVAAIYGLEPLVADLAGIPNRTTAIESELLTPLAINSLTVTGSGVTSGIAETGATITPTLTWTLSKDGTSQSIDQGVGAVTPVSARTVNAASKIADTTWTLTVNNNTLKTVTRSVTLSFQRKRYYGVTTKAPGNALTNAEVLALTGEYATALAMPSHSFNCTGGRYPVICWPQAFGSPSSITVGGLAFTDYTIETMSVTNASGSTATYNVLRFNGLQTGAAISVVI